MFGTVLLFYPAALRQGLLINPRGCWCGSSLWMLWGSSLSVFWSWTNRQAATPTWHSFGSGNPSLVLLLAQGALWPLSHLPVPLPACYSYSYMTQSVTSLLHCSLLPLQVLWCQGLFPVPYPTSRLSVTLTQRGCMIKICYKHKQRSSVEPQKLSLATDKLYIIKLYNLVWNLHTQGSQASISILQETLSLFIQDQCMYRVWIHKQVYITITFYRSQTSTHWTFIVEINSEISDLGDYI